jgi:2-polyprenyl-6-methoxyphenol hydroxylase-like FAD-dependent oxidoreductase
MDKIPVLIVGAGPTGLTLACELARRNINFRIIDRSSAYQTGSRAKGVQPRSQEILNDLDVMSKMDDSGLRDLIFRRFEGSKLLGDVPRPVFPRNDTRYIQGLVIPQWKVEELLREKLAEYHVSVDLGTELISLSQTDEAVTAVLKDPPGRNNEYSCDYLIGCDGGKGGMRKMLGIKFEGETHEEEKMLVGDVKVEGLIPDAWHVWTHPQYGFSLALCPFACTDNWQIQALAGADVQGNIPEPTLETFNRIVQERAQMPEVILSDITWHSIYRVNVRMADRYRVGRVFIAGDAAHAHSIAGGLGMNTGIQDAYNLGWKLAAVVGGRAGATLLDTYEEERLPIAAWTLNITSERQKAIMAAGFASTATKDTTQLNLNYRYSSLAVDLTGKEGLLHAGDRAPDAELADGSWLSDLYRGTHFTVLGFGGTDLVIDAIRQALPGTAKAYGLTDESAAAAYGNREGLFVIRPDGYIGLIAEKDDEKGVVDYLRRFGSPVPMVRE